MDGQEINMEVRIPAGEAARLIGVPASTFNLWLRNGEVVGKQGITGRWYVRVGDLLRLLTDRGADSELLADVNERLRSEITPKYGRGASVVRSHVLSMG